MPADVLGQKFDDVLRNLAGQAGSLEALLRVFFSFLHRNTDFYVTYDLSKTDKAPMGFPEGRAEQLLLRAFGSFPYEPYGDGHKKRSGADAESTRRSASVAAATTRGSGLSRREDTTADPETLGPKIAATAGDATLGDGGQPSTTPQAAGTPYPPLAPQKLLESMAATSSLVDGSLPSKVKPISTATATATTTPTETPIPATAATTRSSDPATGGIRARYTEDGKQIPIDNGGVTPKYYWTQTLTEATVYVDVPAGTRSKDVSCVIQPRRLKLKVRGAGRGRAASTIATASGRAGSGYAGEGGGGDEDVLIDGELLSAVSREDSMWSLNDGNTVVISFEKATRSWWKSVVEGDPEIDTSKVTWGVW